MKMVRLERVATQTLLGLRFWDRLLDRPVADGLHVTAQRLTADRSQRLGRRVTGTPTPGNVIAFFGLTADEFVSDTPEQQIWQTKPADQLVAIDLVDRLGRYLPLSFVAQLPIQGAFKGRGDWLATPLLRPIPAAGAELGVHLWSAANRSVPVGKTAIHAQLVVGTGDEPPPAAYALVKVTQTSAGVATPFQYFGVTDQNGRLLLPLPYPPVPDPEDSTYSALENQTFALKLTVRYSIAGKEPLPGSTVPNLENIFSQPQANIGTYWNEDHPPGLQTSLDLDLTLRFGQSLVLRTTIGSSDAEEAEPVLRIQPVA